ncbi:uncharacterized protein LOC126903272 [Daktulosphaira vitifoliae]|uniref:uncharacterized protein LOC126903272 n=1 Tax=Daktulosphaira vitifoliae TaxID=58002 RepID=UPI0021AAE79B|nr:uncharacterized protein LOC126903272 [Daktulosphaira vitifoliae]
MNFFNCCFALIVILIQLLPSNVLLLILSEQEKIKILNEKLENVDAWENLKSIKVKHGKGNTMKIFTVNDIFDNIEYIKYVDQNITQLVEIPYEQHSSKYLHVNSFNYENKVNLIFEFIKCKCWEQIKLTNRLLSYMTNDYKIIYQDKKITQDKRIEIKNLLLKKIVEYKELVRELYNSACFFKSLLPEGNNEISATDQFFSKLSSIINMPLPEGDKFAINFNKILKKSFSEISNISRNICVYSNKLTLEQSYYKHYNVIRANTQCKESFAEFMSTYFDFFVKETYNLFSKLSLNEKLE